MNCKFVDFLFLSCFCMIGGWVSHLSTAVASSNLIGNWEDDDSSTQGIMPKLRIFYLLA